MWARCGGGAPWPSQHARPPRDPGELTRSQSRFTRRFACLCAPSPPQNPFPIITNSTLLYLSHSPSPLYSSLSLYLSSFSCIHPLHHVAFLLHLLHSSLHFAFFPTRLLNLSSSLPSTLSTSAPISSTDSLHFAQYLPVVLYYIHLSLSTSCIHPLHLSPSLLHSPTF